MTVLNIISGNLAASIPDHLLQFLAGPNIFSILLPQVQNI